MKRILLASLVFLGLAQLGTAQLTRVVVERSNDGSTNLCGASAQPTGTITYRVYAEMQDADDFVSAIAALEGCHPLNISTTTDFYNSPIGGALGNNLNTALCGSFPEGGFDSFITIGQASTGDAGVTQAAFTNPVAPLAPSFGDADGTSFEISDGTIYTLNGSSNGLPVGPDNRVFLGQFTTDGDFSFDINLQVFDGGDGSQNLFYVSSGALDCFYDPANPFPNMPTVLDGSEIGLIYDSVNDVDGCTDVTAINYNAEATLDDGSCEYEVSDTNDTPETAEPLTLNIAAGPGTSCNGYNGEDLNGASSSTQQSITSSLFAELPGLWYSFVPFSSGNQITVQTEDFDAVIEVYDINLLQLEGVDGMEANANEGPGNEIFQIGNLTAGNPYFVRVTSTTPISETANFDICVQTFRDTRCDYPNGTYSLCQMYKADFVYSNAYQFHFTSQTTGLTYSSDAQTSTFLVLRNVEGLPFGDVYDVEIESIYYMENGAGVPQTVVVANDEPCEITIADAPVIKMRAQDNIPNHGPHYPGNYIRTNSYACSAIGYTWRLTRTDVTELPHEYTTATSSTFVRISDILGNGVTPGGVYDVQVKPVFANGQEAEYGEVESISIIGAAGIIGEVIVANEITEDAQRDETLIAPEGNVYPNPTSGLVNIAMSNLDEEQVLEVSVTDFLGRTVSQGTQSAQDGSVLMNMDLSTLAAGTYLMHIAAGEYVQTEKLVIVK